MLTIKDYLLFLGCEVYIFPIDTITEWLPNLLSKDPEIHYSRITSIENIKDTVEQQYLPILRRIENITSEERTTAIKFNMSSADDWIAKANRTRYLIEIGVDVFGWIDKGLALDKKLFPIQ